MASSAVSSLLNGWLDGYKKMFCYQGRARRRDFAVYMLVQLVLFFVLMFVAMMFGKALGNSDHPLAIALVGVYMLIWFLGTLAYNVRRFHDAGQSGLWCLGYFGFAAFVVGASLVLPPTVGDNKYGENPRVID